ncbi:MAG: aromatic ring-opening dioxygenase subunit LigB [Thermomicrobiales bacterium]|nr:aromatic ring-opening dioxygenase subunit LigB [Thermomicrobiales bacterium]
MPLVFAAIAPHGFPLIPDLAEDAGGARQTRAAMLELQRRAAAAGVEAVVLAGPHGVRVNGAVALADTGRAAGSLAWEGRTVELNVPVDGALTDAIAGAARERGVPIALVGYGGSRRAQSVLPLDWGLLTPLWFLGHDHTMPGQGHVLADPPAEDTGPPAVLVTPSRSVPRPQLVQFGEAVAAVAAASPRRIAFVASCDWGHRHDESGPYGYHPASAEVDADIVAAVAANDLLSLRDFPDARAEAAAIDGLWQLLMLAGALTGTNWPSDVISYEAPTYYGMLVATWGEPRA